MCCFRSNAVRYATEALATFLVAGLSSGASGQTARENTNATLRADCRLAAQTLEKGHPAPRSGWALSIIYRCSESGGSALGMLWAAAPADSVTLEQLVRASSKLLDERVYTGVLTTARNRGAPRAVRLAALRVLCAYIRPTTMIDADMLSRPNPDTAVFPTFWTVSHGLQQTTGAQPLPPGVRSETKDLFATLSRSEPDPVVRSAGRVLSRRFFAEP